MTPDELESFLARDFPQVAADFTIDALDWRDLTLRLKPGDRHLRPGGTVSGPSLFALADVAVYLMILAEIGPRALAVTTSGSIDFMRKPAAGRHVIARARLLKLGRTLAVGDVLLFSDGKDDPVARATLTYSIPSAGTDDA